LVTDQSLYRLFDDISSIMSNYAPKELVRPQTLDLIHNTDFIAFLDTHLAITMILDFQAQGYFYISENIKELWGYDRVEFYQHGLQKTITIFPVQQNEIIIHKIFPTMFEFFDQHALSGDAGDLRASYPTKVIRSDGSEGWYLHQIKVLHCENQKPLIALKIITDISDYKKDEGITLTISKKDSNGIFKNIFSKSFSEHTKNYSISGREKEILQLLDEGKSSIEISQLLFISNHTVKTHRKNLLKKFEATSTVDMLNKASVHGII
jgi:DNA-binding CsgD family transcriptional regulator